MNLCFFRKKGPPVAVLSYPEIHPTNNPNIPQIVVGRVTGAYDYEITMIKQGSEYVNRVLATAAFKTEVLNASFTETNGLTNQQIYNLFCSKVVSVDVDMYLGSYWTNHVSHTIGYEDEPGLVHCNRYFVDGPYILGSNLIHEGMGHSMGFSHYGVKATSVPYVLNDIFETIAATLGIKNE